MKKHILFLVLIFLFTACSVEKLVKKYAPEIKFKDLKFQSIDLKGFNLALTLTINNDKVNKTFKIIRNKYSVFIEGKKLVTVENKKEITLPPKKNVDYKQVFHVEYKDALGIIKDLFNKDRVKVKVKGLFFVKVAGRDIKVPVTKEFSVNVPKLPVISLKNIMFMSISRVILILELENKSKVPISMAAGNFTLYVGNQDVLNAKTKKISIDKNSKKNIRVPVKINVLKAMQVVSKLKNWEKLKVKIKGYFVINTPVKKLKIPFEL